MLINTKYLSKIFFYQNIDKIKTFQINHFVFKKKIMINNLDINDFITYQFDYNGNCADNTKHSTLSLLSKNIFHKLSGSGNCIFSNALHSSSKSFYPPTTIANQVS